MNQEIMLIATLILTVVSLVITVGKINKHSYEIVFSFPSGKGYIQKFKMGELDNLSDYEISIYSFLKDKIEKGDIDIAIIHNVRNATYKQKNKSENELERFMTRIKVDNIKFIENQSQCDC